MGKHAPDGQPKKLSKSAQQREKNLEKFQELFDDNVQYIGQCLKADMPCPCSRYISTEKLSTGQLCPNCLGTGKVPNHELRQWASEQINPRVAPAPKAVEQTITADPTENYGKKLETLGTDELEKLEKDLDITFSDGSENK